MRLHRIVLILILVLSGCQAFLPTPIPTLTISFSPSVIPSTLEAEFSSFTQAFSQALLEEGYALESLELRVEKTNQEAQDRVSTGLSDIAWLRVNNFLAAYDDVTPMLGQTWTSYVYDELSAYQSSEVPTLQPGIYQNRSLILTTPSTLGRDLRTRYESSGALSWIDLNAVRWCHVIVTSYEGYIFPSLWMMENYQRRLSELNTRQLVVQGFPELIERAALEECDVIVGPQSLRDEYADSWIRLRQEKAPGSNASIYDELFPIGMSEPYTRDVFVASKLSEQLDESILQVIKKVWIQMATNQHPFFVALKVEGLGEVNFETYDSMRQAYDYLVGITN